MNGLKLISYNEAAMVRDAAVKILLKYGFYIENENILKRLEKKGLKIDYPKFHAELNEDIINKLERCAAESGNIRSAEEYIRRPLKKGISIGRNIVQTIDIHSGERRYATRRDNIDFLKAAQSIDKITAAAPIYTACDLPKETEVIYAVADSVLYSAKPMGGYEIMEACQLPYIEELLTIKNGRQERITNSFASMTRFTLDRRAAACLEAIAERNGLTDWGTNSCIFPGINGPLTLLGSCAMAMAEIIGGWVCGYAFCENIRLNCIPVSGTMDMQTTRMLYSTPAAVLQDAMLSQIFDMLYHIPTGADVAATYVDAKYPGTRALQDKTFKSLALFAYTGCNVGVHFGMLEGGASISPAQLMLDLELNEKLERLTVGATPCKDELRLDDLLEHGPHGDYLQTDHTFDNYSTYLFSERYCDTSSHDLLNSHIDMERDNDRLNQAAADYEAAVKNYSGGCSCETEREVQKILKAAHENCII